MYRKIRNRKGLTMVNWNKTTSYLGHIGRRTMVKGRKHFEKLLNLKNLNGIKEDIKSYVEQKSQEKGKLEKDFTYKICSLSNRQIKNGLKNVDSSN